MRPQINSTDPTESIDTLLTKLQKLDAKIKRRTPADFIKKIRREGMKNERIWRTVVNQEISL